MMSVFPNKKDIYVLDGRTPNQVNVNDELGRENVNFPAENEIAVHGGIDTCYVKGCIDGKTDEFIPNPNYNATEGIR